MWVGALAHSLVKLDAAQNYGRWTEQRPVEVAAPLRRQSVSANMRRLQSNVCYSNRGSTASVLGSQPRAVCYKARTTDHRCPLRLTLS